MLFCTGRPDMEATGTNNRPRRPLYDTNPRPINAHRAGYFPRRPEIYGIGHMWRGPTFPPVEADYTSRFLEEAKCAIPLMESDRRPVAYNADDPAAGQIEHIIRGPKPRRPIKKNGA